MGRLFIVEGIDGSGKTTQVARTAQRLHELGVSVRTVKLPNYDYSACEPVKLYLAGEFGSSPEDVNAYAASSFYAIDRYASYQKFWKEDYLSGTVILSDRYVSSNIIHQCGKLPVSERSEFLTWLDDFEYNKMGIPRPDAVFYLDMPPVYSLQQLSTRYEGDVTKKDIHEKDIQYLEHCYQMGQYACSKLGFVKIPCVTNDGTTVRSVDEINAMIFSEIIKRIFDREG